jgi:hypothetical protein
MLLISQYLIVLSFLFVSKFCTQKPRISIHYPIVFDHQIFKGRFLLPRQKPRTPPTMAEALLPGS